MKSPEYSIIVPVRNEDASVEPLVRGIDSAMTSRRSWEAVFVDDHSTDDTADILARTCRKDRRVNSFSLENDRGKDHALAHGFWRARGSVIITIDGDMQNPPEEIPRLLKMLTGCDMVCGYRVSRRDSLPTRAVSLVANVVRRRITGDTIKDAGCALRAFRSTYVPLLIHLTPLFRGNAHYFYPMMIELYGGSIRQIPVNHLPRLTGRSKFSHIRGRLLPGLRACAVMKLLKRKGYRDRRNNP